MKTLGKAPMIGVIRAELSSLAAIARCTSAKFVVQYPNDRQKPRPKMRPTQSPNGLSPPNPEPRPRVQEGLALAEPSRSQSPPKPPTSDSAM